MRQRSAWQCGVAQPHRVEISDRQSAPGLLKPCGGVCKTSGRSYFQRPAPSTQQFGTALVRKYSENGYFHLRKDTV